MDIAKSISDMKRVWKVTRKPTKKDYFLTLKVVFIGFLIIGVIGFIVELLWQFLLKGCFGEPEEKCLGLFSTFGLLFARKVDVKETLKRLIK